MSKTEQGTRDLTTLQHEREATYASLATLRGQREERERQDRQRRGELEAARVEAARRVLVEGPADVAEPPPLPPPPDFAADESKLVAKIAELEAKIVELTEASVAPKVREAEAAVDTYRAALAKLGATVREIYREAHEARISVVKIGAELHGLVAGVRHDKVGGAQLQQLRQHLRALGAEPTEDQVLGLYVVGVVDHLRRGSSPVPSLAETYGPMGGSMLYDPVPFPDALGVRDHLPLVGLEV